jgi:hypothetical protein
MGASGSSSKLKVSCSARVSAHLATFIHCSRVIIKPYHLIGSTAHPVPCPSTIQRGPCFSLILDVLAICFRYRHTHREFSMVGCIIVVHLPIRPRPSTMQRLAVSADCRVRMPGTAHARRLTRVRRHQHSLRLARSTLRQQLPGDSASGSSCRDREMSTTLSFVLWLPKR